MAGQSCYHLTHQVESSLMLTRYRVLFFAFAAVIGMVVGLATLALIELIAWVQFLGFGDSSETRFVEIANSAADWRVVAAPTLGGVFVGVLLCLVPGRRFHGIADVMEACAFNSGRIGVRSGLGAVLATGVSLGSGVPLGREGPAVHIGASLAAWLAERLGLNRSHSLTLLGCGAAAAVTTSFNAPIAGVLFALEVVVGYYTLRVFAPVVVASMSAIVVRNYFYGGEPFFTLPQYALGSLWEMPLFALLGVCSAILVCGFTFGVGQLQRLWQLSKVPDWSRPAIAGLVIGLLALWEPQVLGTGFETVSAALQGSIAPGLLLLVLVLKTSAIALALASGFAGGVFGPAVFMGALFGGLFYALPVALGFSAVSLSGVYAIVGIAGVASAMLGAPISTVLIVFELTRSYDVTIAVMIAAAFSSAVMQLGAHSSFFRWQLHQRGVNISAGRDVSLLMTHTIAELVSKHYSRLESHTRIRDAERQLGYDRRRVAVVFDNNQFIGITDLREIVAHSIEHGFDQPVGDALQAAHVAVNPSTNVVMALQIMAEHDIDYLPVVWQQTQDQREFVGVVFKNDLLTEHYEVLRRAREEEFGVN